MATHCFLSFVPFKRALDIMDVMLERDVEPNLVTYGTAISACARGGTCSFFKCFTQSVKRRIHM